MATEEVKFPVQGETVDGDKVEASHGPLGERGTKRPGWSAASSNHASPACTMLQPCKGTSVSSTLLHSGVSLKTGIVSTLLVQEHRPTSWLALTSFMYKLGDRDLFPLCRPFPIKMNTIRSLAESTTQLSDTAYPSSCACLKFCEGRSQDASLFERLGPHRHRSGCPADARIDGA